MHWVALERKVVIKKWLYSHLRLVPKEHMVFFEFQLGFHGMSLQPILLIFLELVLLFEIYLGMKRKSQNYL